MTEPKNVREALQRDVELLAQARDELRVQIRLARKEAQQEWSRLETTWERVQSELMRATEQTKEPVKELGQAARGLIDELKQGYERVKAQLNAK